MAARRMRWQGASGGTWPRFYAAAPPELGDKLFDRFVAITKERHPHVQTGVFGADMKLSLTNDGPVTIWLRIDPPAAR